MLRRLVLTDVRNHHALTLAPAAGFVILTGPNGAGKTNVLEAVSLLTPGRGLRRAPLSEVARHDGPGGFGIAATLADGTELATGTLATAPERRVVRVNAAAASAGALAERIAVLWLTPAMDRLFTDTASERRRFLDRLTLAFEPRHARHTSRYDAAMRDRNRLLAEGQADGDWLSALEAQMAEHGAALADARARTVSALHAALSRHPRGDIAHPSVSLDGWAGGAGELAEALRHGRARDAAAGRTLIGPHRGDLIVRHCDKDQPAALASTGEQKAMLLAIVLAHAELVVEHTGRAPGLLLDEVAAHLDPARRAALFERLDTLGQVWMTGTEPALFDAIGAATRITL